MEIVMIDLLGVALLAVMLLLAALGLAGAEPHSMNAGKRMMHIQIDTSAVTQRTSKPRTPKRRASVGKSLEVPPGP